MSRYYQPRPFSIEISIPGYRRALGRASVNRVTGLHVATNMVASLE